MNKALPGPIEGFYSLYYYYLTFDFFAWALGFGCSGKEVWPEGGLAGERNSIWSWRASSCKYLRGIPTMPLWL